MIPVIIKIAAVALGGLVTLAGAGGHITAKETNNHANSVINEARKKYDDARARFEKAQKHTENTLAKLGVTKKSVLESSMTSFLNMYEKIKRVEIKKMPEGLELSSLMIEQKDVVEMRELTGLYSTSLGNGVVGVATGTLAALAVSGNLALVTNGLALAGSALSIGEIGAAAGLAGSSVALGAALTPVGALIPPVVFFTAFSANDKADENLEKAEAKLAEVNAAVEKMKTVETLFTSICDRAELYDKTLKKINGLFDICLDQLEIIINDKISDGKKNELSAEDFTVEELKIIGTTRAIAGTIKTIIDTPIINKEGELTAESEKSIKVVEHNINSFRELVNV